MIIRYLTSDFPNAPTGGAITTDGSYTIHTFTSSGTFSVPAAPPTNPAAVSVDGGTDITITWTDSADTMTSYRIERSNDGSTGWAEVGSVNPAVQTFTDTVGTASVTRYYRVRGRNGVNNTDYTSVVNAKTAPAAPSGLAVAAANDSNNLTLTWTDNSSDEDVFSIERSNNGSTGWAEIATDAASPYVDSSVGARDTTRYYRIRAKRNAEPRYSAYSSTASATTAPANPTTIAAAVSGQDVTVTFDDVSTSNTSTKLERKVGSTGTFAELVSLGASVESHLDEDLTHNQTYYYKARAHRSSDDIYSGYSDTVDITIPPEPPQNLNAACSVRAANASKVRLSWEIYSEKETGFKIERSTNNVDWTTVTTTAAGVRTYEDTGLAIDTTYYYRVSAAGPDGASTPTSTVTVKTSRGRVADLLLGFDKKVGQFPLS